MENDQRCPVYITFVWPPTSPCFFLKRTPAPPPFSAMNSTPGAS